MESRLFENAIGRLGQLRRSAKTLWTTFKSKAKKEVKSELKSQGKEALEGQLDDLIDGMSQAEFANHFCAREGWEGACPGHPSTFPPNVQKGPGNRCDCTPGHCWEWTGKKDPWYAYGWECTKQKANMKKWVTAQTNKKDAKDATQSPDGHGHGEGSNEYEEDWERQFELEVLPAIYGGVGGLTFIICICLACCCLRSREKSAQQSVEQMVNQRMAEQIVNQRMAQHTQAWEKDRN